MIDVRELKENYPDFVLVLDVDDEESPKFSDLAYRRVPVHNVAVGSYILVGAGEVSKGQLPYLFIIELSCFLKILIKQISVERSLTFLCISWSCVYIYDAETFYTCGASQISLFSSRKSMIFLLLLFYVLKVPNI